MPPTALIIVSRETATGDLCATLPIAGRTLIEHQAHRLAAAGVGGLILVASDIPPALAAAVGRLRDDGIGLRVAGDAAAAVALAGSGGLLLLADGVLPQTEALGDFMIAGGPALLVWADNPQVATWERIDGGARWAGLAQTDAVALAATAAMVGDWDLELTLVRGLVADAARVTAAAGATVRIDDAGDARAIAEAVMPRGGGPLGRVSDALLNRIVDRPIPAWGVAAGAVTSATAGALAAGFGPLWLAAPLLLAAPPVERLASRLAAARLAPAEDGLPWLWGMWSALAAALPFFGWRLSAKPGWEPLLLALATLVFFAALDGEVRRGTVRDRWIARAEAMLWLGAGFAISGHGVVGLAAMTAWVAASFFRLQRKSVSQPDQMPPYH